VSKDVYLYTKSHISWIERTGLINNYNQVGSISTPLSDSLIRWLTQWDSHSQHVADATSVNLLLQYLRVLPFYFNFHTVRLGKFRTFLACNRVDLGDTHFSDSLIDLVIKTGHTAIEWISVTFNLGVSDRMIDIGSTGDSEALYFSVFWDVRIGNFWNCCNNCEQHDAKWHLTLVTGSVGDSVWMLLWVWVQLSVKWIYPFSTRKRRGRNSIIKIGISVPTWYGL